MKKADHGFVRLGLVEPFVEFLSRCNVDLRSTLRSQGLDMAAINDPNRYVQAETVYALHNALAEAAGDRHLGFHVGEWFPFSDWPPFQGAARQARTLGELLTLIIEAVPNQANSVRYRLAVEKEGASYQIRRLVRARNSPQHTEAFGIAEFAGLIRDVAGNAWDPNAVSIHTGYPDAVPPEIYGATVNAGTQGNMEIRFPTDWLHIPLAPDLFKSCARTDHETGQEMTVTAAIAFRSALDRHIHHREFRVEDIAGELGMDGRSLKKELEKEGTTAAQELRRFRMERAKAALARTDVSISTIAFDLGYTDPAHFSRFFKSQVGQSPRAYRKQCLESA